jgi:hypothetical protein
VDPSSFNGQHSWPGRRAVARENLWLSSACTSATSWKGGRRCLSFDFNMSINGATESLPAASRYLSPVNNFASGNGGWWRGQGVASRRGRVGDKARGRLIVFILIVIFVRSQESGVRSQESGVRSRESGVGSRESGKAFYPLALDHALQRRSMTVGLPGKAGDMECGATAPLSISVVIMASKKRRCHAALHILRVSMDAPDPPPQGLFVHQLRGSLARGISLHP